MHLTHRTTETGHVRQSPRSEIDDDAIRRLAPMLRRALNTGQPVRLAPTAWTITATETADRLDAQAWHGERTGDPHIRLAVTGRTLTASMAGLAAIRSPTRAAEAAIEAGDLERCLAWTWIESRPAN